MSTSPKPKLKAPAARVREILERMKRRAETYWPLPGGTLEQTVVHEISRQVYLKGGKDALDAYTHNDDR